MQQEKSGCQRMQPKFRSSKDDIHKSFDFCKEPLSYFTWTWMITEMDRRQTNSLNITPDYAKELARLQSLTR